MPRPPATKVCGLSFTADADLRSSVISQFGDEVADRLGLTRKQLIHSVEASGGPTRHEKMLRRRIEEGILQTAANEDLEIDEGELKRLVFLEEASKKTYVVSKIETDVITKYIWDKNLKGTREKRVMEKLYEECDLPATAVARRDKIDTKVRNVYRTYRETKEMFEDEDQAVEDLAGRLSMLISCFKERDGALEALEAYGILVHGADEMDSNE